MKNTVDISDIDPNNYFPIQDGTVPQSSVRMDKFSNLPPEKQKIFEIDEGFGVFLKNKQEARSERLSKYYQKTGKVDISAIIKFICEKLAQDWPEYFYFTEMKRTGVATLQCKLTDDTLVFDTQASWQLLQPENKYVDSFDALAMQIQEDIVVCTLPEGGKDYVSYAHLTSPSGWSAEWAIGKTFWEIHENVLKSDDRPVIKNSEKIVRGILRSPTSFRRVGALSLRSDAILNRHPENAKPDNWTFDENQKLLLRFERQTVTSFPEINSFFFTVRTYYNDLTKQHRIDTAINALQNSHKDAYAPMRNFVNEHGESCIEFLQNLKEQYVS